MAIFYYKVRESTVAEIVHLMHIEGDNNNFLYFFTKILAINVLFTYIGKKVI